MGLGISLITKSNLGTSAVSSIPYVLSQVFVYSFGFFTVILNFFFVSIQVIFLKNKFPKNQFLQYLVGPLLGLFIDFWMKFLRLLNPNIFIIKFIILNLGCIILGVGIYFQLKANVINNPAEGITKLISDKLNTDFSITKIFFDITLVFISLIISYVALNKIVGLGIGTIISAVLVGYVVKLMFKIESRYYLNR